MAIIPKGEQLKRQRNNRYREMLLPFTMDESGIQALRATIGNDRRIGRDGMYILEILNNLIQNNGKQNLYQRIPPEIFRGCAEGGRRNVEASLICRADGGADGPEQGRDPQESGYTRIQEVIGRWAERDGSWSDTPEKDLEKAGYSHRPEDGGSEARIFKKKNSGYLVKTINFSHYDEFEKMFDNIAARNAAFPEMAVKVIGFGIREDAEDNTGYVITVRQPFAKGRVPQPEEIERNLAAKDYDLSDSGYFYVSRLGNVVLSDVNESNCVINESGDLLVFDCDGHLKTFPVNKAEKPEVFDIGELLPTSGGKLDSKRWRDILGDNYLKYSEDNKSAMLKQLRLTGRLPEPIGGKVLYMTDPEPKKRTLPDGRVISYFDGTVAFGSPAVSKEEHIYKVPEVRYTDAAVKEIGSVIRSVLPHEMSAYEFFRSPELIGLNASSFNGGTRIRKRWRDELRADGRIDGLVNNKWIVQVNPDDASQLLVSDKENLGFMLWTNSGGRFDAGRLTPEEIETLAQGKALYKDGNTIFFNLDKGRIDVRKTGRLRLALTHKHEMEARLQKPSGPSI